MSIKNDNATADMFAPAANAIPTGAARKKIVDRIGETAFFRRYQCGSDDGWFVVAFVREGRYFARYFAISDMARYDAHDAQLAVEREQPRTSKHLIVIAAWEAGQQV